MTEHTGGIVVGVDGSEASVAALRWAAGQARALGTEVVVVHAWEAAAAGPLPARAALQRSRPPGLWRVDVRVTA